MCYKDISLTEIKNITSGGGEGKSSEVYVNGEL